MFLHFGAKDSGCLGTQNRWKIHYEGVVFLFVYLAGCATVAPLDLEQDGGQITDDGTEPFSDLDTETLEENTGETDDPLQDSDPDSNSEHSDTASETDTATDPHINTDSEPAVDTDQCPDDDTKINPGVCGCGIPEGTCVIPCANGKGLLDPDTQLCWQDPKFGNALAWSEAVDYCEGLTMGGASNWRLPKISELIDLLGGCDADLLETKDGNCNTCKNSPACSKMFPLDAANYWARTIGGDGTAWLARFKTGHLNTVDQLVTRRVRCVWR